MKAIHKQQIILGLSIFISLTSIGFSFHEQSTTWLWHRIPLMALSLMTLAFVLIRFWIRIELDRQKENILEAFQNPNPDELKVLHNLLSEREKQVLDFIVLGKSNKEIADLLYIALSTVKTHINNIYKILEVQSRREAIDKIQKLTDW
jgi:DNA-binding CsgD family transcriptional regulator